MGAIEPAVRSALLFLVVGGPLVATGVIVWLIFSAGAFIARKSLAGMERMRFESAAPEYRAAARMFGWSGTIAAAAPAAVLALASLSWLPGLFGLTYSAYCALVVAHAVYRFAAYRTFNSSPQAQPGIEPAGVLS